MGGALLYWWHTTDTDWALVSVAALVFVLVAYMSKRSSWAVLGAIGLLAAGAHFANEWSPDSDSSFSSVASASDWAPYAVFAFVGFLLVFLGLRGRRRLARAEVPPTP